MKFKNRLDAAQKLAQALEPYQQNRPLILGIARGAVPMAHQIAQTLGTDWDVLLAKKLGAPDRPEFAVAAVEESGWVYKLDLCYQLGISDAHLEAEKHKQLAAMKARRSQYDGLRPAVSRQGRLVIVIDDGLATGATMLAALHGLRDQGASKIVCAVPIASAESLQKVQQMADSVICLQQLEAFFEVSQGYDSFEQVGDDQILTLLRQNSRQP